MKTARILAIAMLISFMAVAPLYAEGEGFDQEHVYKYPDIQPEYGLWGGYTFTDANGSRRAGEFVYFEDSPAGGGYITAFPFPHRFHWQLDIMNEEDYFSDLRYSYKDLILVRSVNRALFHNLGDIDLRAPSGVAPLNDPTGDNYGYGTALGHVSVRLKAPNFPAHAFINTWYVRKDGDRQQRRMGGSAHFANRQRVTERRTVDWDTTDYTFGLNSHLGPVEAQYSHSELRFKARNGVDSFAYAAGGGRLAGTYPHSVVPTLESSTEAFKIHTSYTGRIVASGTFIASDDRNKTSGASADNYIAAGEVVWTPVSKFTAALRYRYEERDVDNPDTLPAGFLGFGSFTAVNNIKNTMSTDVSTLMLLTRYRPTNKITIGTDATFRHWDRDNAAAWKLPEETDEVVLGLTANVKALKNLKLKAHYHYRAFDDPAHTTQPDSAHKADLSTTWTPHARVTLFTGVSVAKEENDLFHLHSRTDAGNPDGLVEGRNRDVTRNTLTATVTYAMRDNLSLTGTYGYWNNKIEQDITYVQGGPPTPPDPVQRVEGQDITRNFTASVNYSPLEQLDLTASMGYTEASSGYDSTNGESDFSKLDIRETSYEFRANYEVVKNLDLGFRFEYRDFENLIDHPNNPDSKDGSARIFFVTVNKRW